MDTNKTPIYPFEPWNVTEDHLDLAMNYRNETTFALSNGYIGTRGTHEEAYDFDEQHGLEGNFLNGLLVFNDQSRQLHPREAHLSGVVCH